MNLQSELENKLREWGATFSGYSRVKGKLPGNLESLEYAVTIGVRLSDAIIDEITDRPTHTYFHHYRMANALLDLIALRTTHFIMEKGYKAFAVPASQSVNDGGEDFSGIFPHKTAAVMAGLGWIGKNGLFIHRHYGPRVRLATVLTDMQLPSDNGIMDVQCGSCRLCVDSCPAAALTGNCWQEGCDRRHVVDARACSEYMKKSFRHIGRGYVCGICIKVCPVRKRSQG